MNDEMLDERIRSIVAAAAAAAPTPHDYEQLDAPRLISVSPAARRRWWPAAAVITTAAAAAVALLVVRTSGPADVDPATVTLSPVPVTTGSPEPASTVEPPPTTEVLTTLPWTTVPAWVTGVASPSWQSLADGFVTAGPDGVWEFISGGRAVQWSDQPVAKALKAPDGSMLVQFEAYGSPTATEQTLPEQTLPVVLTAPMVPPVALPASLDPGYYVMHDVVRLTDGRDLLLLEWNSPGPTDPQNGVYPFRRVVAVDLASNEVTTVVADENSFESSVLRLHLTATGIAVGERGSSGQTGMVVVPLPGLSFTPQALTFEDLGLDYAYDYGFGPTGYTIDTPGTRAAWIDAGSLVVKSVSTPTEPASTIALPWWNELFSVTDIDINGSIALITGHQGNSISRSVYLVSLATGESVALGDGSTSATLAP